ncbi:hypothetical protein F4677DRAFT_462361 [Hypoxylon crocopeplum]|nr:hypothetical protein F4677DRAFT_462361 [Hypoxylon crocopeplum]
MASSPIDKKESPVIAGQAMPAPGCTTEVLTFTVFDFLAAFDFVKQELDHETIHDHWPNSIRDAIAICASWSQIMQRQLISRSPLVGSPSNSLTHSGAYSLVEPLATLRGSTAVRDLAFLLDGLKRKAINGNADSMVRIYDIYKDFNHNVTEAEQIIRQNLGKYFPMKILMPKIITLSPPTKASKRQASDDLELPQSKRK